MSNVRTLSKIQTCLFVKRQSSENSAAPFKKNPKGMKTFVKAEPLGIYQIQTQILTGFSTIKQYVVHVVPSTWTVRILGLTSPSLRHRGDWVER